MVSGIEIECLLNLFGLGWFGTGIYLYMTLFDGSIWNVIKYRNLLIEAIS